MVIRAARVLASVVKLQQDSRPRSGGTFRLDQACAHFTLRKLHKIELVPAYANCALGSCPEQLYELIGHEAGFEQLQSGLRNLYFVLTVEASAISPVDPRPPQPGQRAAKPSAWSRVLQASNDASRLPHPAQLSHASNLQLVGKGAEQEGSHRRVERAVGKVKTGHVHLPQFHFCGCGVPPAFV